MDKYEFYEKHIKLMERQNEILLQHLNEVESLLQYLDEIKSLLRGIRNK